MCADVGREPAAMAEDGRLRLRAQVMVSRHALVTVHAAPRVPADADALSDRESFGIRTDGRDPADDLVAENRGVLRNAPVIVQDGEIGVTQPAVFDRDFNVLDPERAEINGFEHHRLFRRLRNPCLIILRGFLRRSHRLALRHSIHGCLLHKKKCLQLLSDPIGCEVSLPLTSVVELLARALVVLDRVDATARNTFPQL